MKAGATGGAASPWADAGEVAGILAGDIIEVRTEVSLDRAEPLAAQKVVVQAHVDRAIAAKKTEWADTLKFAGYGEGTVS